MKLLDLNEEQVIESARKAFGHQTTDPVLLLALRVSQLNSLSKERLATINATIPRARKEAQAAGYAQALEDAIEWLHENFSWSENEMTFHDMADDIRALNKEAGE